MAGSAEMRGRLCRLRCPVGLALFFVRVNQVLVRLWARRGRKSDRMAVGSVLISVPRPGIVFRGVKRSHWIVVWRRGLRAAGPDCEAMRSCCVLSEKRSAVAGASSVRWRAARIGRFPDHWPAGH